VVSGRGERKKLRLLKVEEGESISLYLIGGGGRHYSKGDEAKLKMRGSPPTFLEITSQQRGGNKEGGAK